MSPTLANELVRSLERLGGDSPVTNVRQTKLSAEMLIPGNQCWEGYFANVIGYRLQVTLLAISVNYAVFNCNMNCTLL